MITRDELIEAILQETNRAGLLLRIHKSGGIGRSRITGRRWEGSYREPMFGALLGPMDVRRKEILNRVRDNIGHSRWMRSRGKKLTRAARRTLDKSHLTRLKKRYGTRTFKEELIEAILLKLSSQARRMRLGGRIRVTKSGKFVTMKTKKIPKARKKLVKKRVWADSMRSMLYLKP